MKLKNRLFLFFVLNVDSNFYYSSCFTVPEHIESKNLLNRRWEKDANCQGEAETSNQSVKLFSYWIFYLDYY